MAATGPLARTNQSSKLPEAYERLIESVAEQLSKGKNPYAIAKAVHPHDKRARKRLYQKIRREMRTNPDLSQRVFRNLHARMLYALGPAIDGLAGRAARGRPDAIKLLMEATGFHNPRVKHEHSGDIKISLSIPRPELPKGSDDENIVDADVVEE